MLFNPRNILLSATLFLSTASAWHVKPSCPSNNGGQGSKSTFLTAVNAYRASQTPPVPALNFSQVLEDATVQMAQQMAKAKTPFSDPTSIDQGIHSADHSLGYEYWLTGSGSTNNTDFLHTLEQAYSGTLLNKTYTDAGFTRNGEYYAFVLAVKS